MPLLPDSAWVVIGLIIVAAALAVLHALSSAVRHEIMLHDLKARTARLRAQYRKRLAEAEQGEVLEVDEAPAQRQAA